MLEDPQTTAAIEIRSLSKSFPGQVALDNAELTVRRGEIHALLGQNGSGKSTLIKVLSGFHKPDGGADVELFGRRIDMEAPHSSFSRHIRVMHQDLGLVGSLNVTENLALDRGFTKTRFGRIQWSLQHAETRVLLERFGLDIDPRRTVGTLSEAEHAVVGLARAMQDWDGQDALLILDEPTASMSRPEVQHLFNAVRTVAENGAGVLFVSHRLDEVLELADWVTVLRDGRTVATRSVTGLSEQTLVEDIIGRPQEGFYSTPPEVFGSTLYEARNIWGSVVENFDLDLRAGEIVGIAGIVGSGRDQIAGLLSGSSRRAAGTISIEGSPVPSSPWASQRLGITYVPADRAQLGSLQKQTVSFNITISDLWGLTKYGFLTDRFADREAHKWMETVDVQPRDPDLPLSNLSGGNQQKVVMARLLRGKPRVILLDEPTQGVDVGAKAKIYELLSSITETGAGVVVCSSDAKELASTCDRVLVLRDGHIGEVLHGDDITEEKILEQSLREKV